MIEEPTVATIPGSSSQVSWRHYLRWRDYVPLFRRYDTHSNRALFVIEHYGDLLEGRVLDVCCGNSSQYYRGVLGSRYQGLDIANSYKYDEIEEADFSLGGPDHICNVEREPLPFSAQSYDTVLCIGALEHLDNLHGVYDELFRVARHRVIVQLPNNWPGFFCSLVVGHNYTHRAGYGLQPTPPKPGQRHKWFFNLGEACEFLLGRMPNGWTLRRLDCTFEMGCDSWLLWPIYQKAARFTWQKGLSRLGLAKTCLATFVRPFFYYPVRFFEWTVGMLLWGWRGRVAYHNITCREIWAVYDRAEGQVG
jgi:SAM-dependent methyltransferase